LGGWSVRGENLRTQVDQRGGDALLVIVILVDIWRLVSATESMDLKDNLSCVYTNWWCAHLEHVTTMRNLISIIGTGTGETTIFGIFYLAHSPRTIITVNAVNTGVNEGQITLLERQV
jgi:hypothetical protein